MKDIIFDEFQNCVDEYLLRHRSILDILTKLQETEARTNRAVAKSITNCGCIKIKPGEIRMPTEGKDIDDNIRILKNRLDNQIEGNLCNDCREIIEKEIGDNIFYIASLCNLLDLNLYDILLKEYNRMNTLGKYSLR